MTLDELKAGRQAIAAIAGRYGACNLRLFGSVVRGEGDSATDVDILVEPEPGRSLVELGGLLMDLQGLLAMPGRRDGLAMLKPRAPEQVLREALPL